MNTYVAFVIRKTNKNNKNKILNNRKRVNFPIFHYCSVIFAIMLVECKHLYACLP